MKNISILKCFSKKSCFNTKKNNFFVGDFRFFIVLFSLLCTGFYAQETKIAGLENISVSNGAALISNDVNDASIKISKPSVDSQNITQNDSSIDDKHPIIEKKSFKIAQSKKSSKKIEKKTIKKIEDKEKTEFVYNANKKTENYFYSSSKNLSCFTASHHQFSLGKYIKNCNHFVDFLFEYKNKTHVLYKFYQSQFVENTFFTRPPPVLS